MQNYLKFLFKFKITSVIVLVLLLILTIFISLYKYSPYYGKYFFRPSPAYYGRIAINIIDKNALYATGSEWENIKSKSLENMRDCQTYEETLPHINEALKVAGGKHSFIIKNMPAVPTRNEIQNKPVDPIINCENHNLYISIPPFSGDPSDSKKFKDIIERALLHESYSNVIIDLRENSGGDMGPMITGLSSLLLDGHLLSFVMKDNSEHKVYIKNGEVIGAGTHVKVSRRKYIPVRKIAILISAQTASSGEITALAFDGVKNCKLFGENTAGFTTSNNSIELYDGVMLNITSSKLKTRTGKVFNNNPIVPDVESKSPYNEAITWFDNI